MRKSELIARVLINAGYKATLEQTEFNVRKTFEAEFKGHSFNKWNSIIPNGQTIVDNIGKHDRVNVKSFIIDLWDK